MNKFSVILLAAITCLSQSAYADCHYMKKGGNNFYYSDSNGNAYDFYPVSRDAFGLALAGVKDQYNIGLKHNGEGEIYSFFSCNNKCTIITESFVRVYGFLRGELVGQKQVIRNKKTVLGAAMTDDINGCMKAQEIKDKEESNEAAKQFSEEMQPSSATKKAWERLSNLPDGQYGK